MHSIISIFLIFLEKCHKENNVEVSGAVAISSLQIML